VPFRLPQKYGDAHHGSKSNSRITRPTCEFPAGKRELKAGAKNNQAPPEILKFIDELPEEQYHTMAEVMKAVGEIE
jgi:hypothetical protein